MHVGEIEELFPVVLRHVVPSAANVIADPAGYGMIRRRPLGRGQTIRAQEPIDGVGGKRREKFALRIGAGIFDGA
jgi:hypothetical protein